MSSSSGVGGGRGCGRGRGLGGVGGGGLENLLPCRPGLHYHHEMALPFGDQTRGAIANVVI